MCSADRAPEQPAVPFLALPTEMPFCSLGPPDAVYNPLSVPPTAQGVAVAEQLLDWCQVVGTLFVWHFFQLSCWKISNIKYPKEVLKVFPRSQPPGHHSQVCESYSIVILFSS